MKILFRLLFLLPVPLGAVITLSITGLLELAYSDPGYLALGLFFPLCLTMAFTFPVPASPLPFWLGILIYVGITSWGLIQPTWKLFAILTVLVGIGVAGCWNGFSING
jgi:hypothetical protein